MRKVLNFIVLRQVAQALSGQLKFLIKSSVHITVNLIVLFRKLLLSLTRACPTLITLLL